MNEEIKTEAQEKDGEIVENSGDNEALTEREAAGQKKDSHKKEENLLKEIEALKAEAADMKDKFLRSIAEFDNFRKRTLKERESLF